MFYHSNKEMLPGNRDLHSCQGSATQVQDVKGECQKRSYRVLDATQGACGPWGYKHWRRAGQGAYSSRLWAL